MYRVDSMGVSPIPTARQQCTSTHGVGFNILVGSTVCPHVFLSTGVGAMRLFFGSWVSSFSLSLASRLLPATLTDALLGVSGGVVMGTPVTLAELVAAMPGTFPAMSVGLLTTPAGTADACVATDEVEFDLAGDDGLCEVKAALEAGGDGAVNELAELRL